MRVLLPLPGKHFWRAFYFSHSYKFLNLKSENFLAVYHQLYEKICPLNLPHTYSLNISYSIEILPDGWIPKISWIFTLTLSENNPRKYWKRMRDGKQLLTIDIRDKCRSWKYFVYSIAYMAGFINNVSPLPYTIVILEWYT